ncbi:transglycosylase SLT domain-containing protein [Streptomyces sp. 549]|uniref:aggregation-promoting factor C-terminal-like domain-containing protein n=1 Tax=Streptomyces sp. 549 TaxID=3049076 RepID=UPI0024C45E07|nr:transglycosylase SLT domain-containing protein [Streptomyces sp. 549]MDK1474278.1 transglycosylase SLT domain-containing protein [Streptomyces sp. 549]
MPVATPSPVRRTRSRRAAAGLVMAGTVTASLSALVVPAQAAQPVQLLPTRAETMPVTADALRKGVGALPAQERAAASQPADGQRASRAAGRAELPAGTPQQLARQVAGGDAEFRCFANIVERESGWDHTAQNPSSGAYGLVQALPGDKMASAGSDWRTNPATQIEWGMEYMKDRYGSACGAWSFWQQNHWY